MRLSGRTHRLLESAFSDPAAAAELEGSIRSLTEKVEKLEAAVFPAPAAPVADPAPAAPASVAPAAS